MGRQSRRKKTPAITKPLPKWNPRSLPPPPFHDPAHPPGPVPRLANHCAEFVAFPGGYETADQLDAVNYLSAMLAVNAEQAKGVTVKNPIPPLVTADNIGDATGYTDPRRVFAFGYAERNAETCGPRPWQALALPSLCVVGRGPELGEFIVANRPHLLGATYRLDCPLAFVGARLRYTAPRVFENGSRVVWSGAGDYCVADETEGWDTIIARGTFERTGLQLSRWRGGSRVWVGFVYPNPIPNCESIWSGMAGFEGEPFVIFRDQVLSGKMPSRVFVEWLGENYRFPQCLKADAARCGFTLERN